MNSNAWQSEIISALVRVHVGAENPFFLRVESIVHSAQHYLVWLHLESWTQLLELDGFVVVLFVDVVAEGNEVAVVVECH